MGDKARGFWERYFCKRNAGDTTAHDQKAFNYEGVGNKQPSDFMEITKKWRDMELQTCAVKLC